MNTEKLRVALERISCGSRDVSVPDLLGVASGCTFSFRNSVRLLEESFLLANAGISPTALSLVILSLEELAKIPRMYDLFVDPKTRSSEAAWKELWLAFTKHGSKQKTMLEYGSSYLEKWGVAGPFSSSMSGELKGMLDIAKQRGFYVDRTPQGFRMPEQSADVSFAYDQIALHIQERIWSMGNRHVTVERSLDAIKMATNCIDRSDVVLDELEKLASVNQWATSRNAPELEADLLAIAFTVSRAAVPDYTQANTYFQQAVNGIIPATLDGVISALVRKLHGLTSKTGLDALASRSQVLLKVVVSFAMNSLGQKRAIELMKSAASLS